MSWHKITFPLISDQIDPNVVEIGKLGWDVYQRENKPAGFAMFHATRGSRGDLDDKLLVYLSPVASELCTEVAAKFPMEPCDVPALDEPDIAFVYGDPLMMGQLKPKFEPDEGTIEWYRAQAAAAKATWSDALGRFEALQMELVNVQARFEATQAEVEEARARFEAAQAEEAAQARPVFPESAQAESAEVESGQADSANA